MTERDLGFHAVGCPERAPYGIYGGFACCAQVGHGGMHAITSGSTEPPYHVVVYEWESKSPVEERVDE